MRGRLILECEETEWHLQVELQMALDRTSDIQ